LNSSSEIPSARITILFPTFPQGGRGIGGKKGSTEFLTVLIHIAKYNILTLLQGPNQLSVYVNYRSEGLDSAMVCGSLRLG
jgi:hypothetical protein